MNRMRSLISVFLALVLFLLTGCENTLDLVDSPTETPAVTSTSTLRPSPTNTPIPTNTPTATPSAPQDKFGAETFIDNLDVIDLQVFDILKIEDPAPITHVMISNKDYEALLPTIHSTPSAATMQYFDYLYFMLSVAPMDFDYFAFQEAYNAKLPEYNAGVLSDLNANSIYVVEDYPDKQSQLAQYLFTVSMVAGKRQTLSPNMTVKLAEAYETFDGQQTQTAKSGGVGYYVVREWYERYLLEGEEGVPDLFWQRLRNLDLEVPEFIVSMAEFDFEYGLPFVDEVVSVRGEEAVIDLYINPPLRTDMILHPDLYIQSIVEDLLYMYDLSMYLDENWYTLSNTAQGEYFLYHWLIESTYPDARLEESKAKQISEGWGNDSLTMFGNVDRGDILIEWLITFDKYKSPKFFEEEMEKYSDAIDAAGGVPFIMTKYNNQTFVLIFSTSYAGFEDYFNALKAMLDESQ